MHKIAFQFAVALALLAAAPRLRGQAANNNPTGPAGQFNGNVTTAGSYDPYTANVTRGVTDLVIAGAVGEYGLSYSRSWNSRQGWRDSFAWKVEDTGEVADGDPIPYTVSFPDGRVESFGPPTLGGAWQSGKGTRERFKGLTGSLCYLLLADGGKVEFSATSERSHDGETGEWFTSYYFRTEAIIDRYGQRLSYSYNTDGTLYRVTEPAGRYIQFNYTAGRISSITGSDARTVTYTYTTAAVSPGTLPYTLLTSVRYFGDATLDTTYTYQAPNVGSVNGVPLLKTCNEPMYGGPMKQIYYTYATANNPNGTAASYGQILSEGKTSGQVVSTLTINTAATRTETRADGRTRTFTYDTATGLLTSVTDFKGVAETKAYDANRFVNAVTDRRGNTTNFTNNAFNGATTQVQYPAVTSATPAPAPRGTVNTTYGWAACPDVNNRDANNPYYPYSVTDEAGNATIFTRDTSKRVTRIDYPDTGYETFTYNSFNQVLTHRLTTGGTESFTYDGIGRKLTYTDATGNPTAKYAYDAVTGRLSDVCDALGTSTADSLHTTSFAYNARGQLTTTTLPKDPIDSVRHTLVNAYNADGTLASKTDQRGKVTTYTSDDYRRPLTVTTPLRFAGDPTVRITSFSYDKMQGTASDYSHTDSNVTRLTLPSTNVVRSYYDENYRKISQIASAANLTTDAATASWGYDNEGNIISSLTPNQQPGKPFAGYSTTSVYDERNRLMSVTDSLAKTTSVKFDWGGRKKLVTRPNGQTVTYDTYDAMNRLLQQTVKQTPDPDAVTKYTYFPSGLLQTMQDPRLVALASAYKYSYTYDLMGRKTGVTYPPAVSGTGNSESSTYDAAGRLATFTNREGKIQTFTYDALNRPYTIAWNDSGTTPTVTLAYDIASRVTSINNTNAAITRAYYDDGLLKTETETPAGGSANTVTYSYNADGQPLVLQYPGSAYSFTYAYTGRGQLKSVSNTTPVSSVATFGYDLDGNLDTRTPANSTSSTYIYDALDRLTNIKHVFDTTRTLAYGYDDVSNRKWAKRDSGTGDIFGYDLNDQVTAMKMNVANPDTTAIGAQTITYDWNGNRLSFTPYGGSEAYASNNLSQYVSRTSTPAANVTYDLKGNLTKFGTGTAYVYDAQNRLTSATVGAATATFVYDGLNRQVKRTENGVTTYSVWNGWELIKEYQGVTTTAAYVSGPTGLIKDLLANKYYYQDASGSTSHLASSTGALLEWYRYDLQGTPFYYNAANTLIGSSAHNVNYLFTGQRWMSALGLYDLRNRFYSPDLGRFLQSDPIGFRGDPTNLYRYCGANPVNRMDPFGLWTIQLGFNFTAQIGVGSFSFGVGVVFDGQGNIGGYNSTFEGASGAGASISLGAGGMYSNADTIYGLSGPFAEGSVTAGEEGEITGVAFVGEDANGKKVVGNGIFGGVGGGVGATAGVSTTNVGGTNIFSMFSPRADTPALPAPGGTTTIDPRICPECATTDRVVVSSTPISPLLSTGVTYFSGSGSPFHVGSTGNIINGSAFTVTNSFPGLTSSGGGEWQTVRPGGNFGGQPGEGSHPVGPELE